MMQSSLKLFAILWLAGVSGARLAADDAAPHRPNLLLLVADDQRADCLSCAGHPILQTPHIDALAARGVRFKNAFVTTAICCVSRASLMTGRYARSHGVADFVSPLSPTALAASLPVVLRQNGYRVGCFGKWGIGGGRPLDSFDEWDAWSGQGEFFHDVDGKRVHNSEYLALRTREFLASQPSDRPFCLIVYFKSPHDPYQPDPRDAGLFADVRIPEPATYTDEHFARLPEFIRKSEGRTRALKAHPDRDAWQEFTKQYLRCIASIDRAVGQIVADLEREGMSENTVIAYTSDNGFFLGERGLSHKWLMYEESIRVPLILCDPRSPAERRGVEEEALAVNIDLAPTFFDLAGAATPHEVDGVSLAPWLSGRPPAWREDFFYEHHFHNGRTIPRTEGVRSASAKYVRYFDEGEKYEEYFDLRSDPHEERNRAADPAAAAERERLRKRYQEYLRILPPAVVPR